MIDFADDCIERTAPHRALIVIRNDEGHITELAGRCGTPTVAFKELMEERQRIRSLH